MGFQPKWALTDIPIMPKVILSLNLINVGFEVCAVARLLNGLFYLFIYISLVNFREMKLQIQEHTYGLQH